MTIEDTCPSCGGILTLPPPDWGEIFTFFVTSTNIKDDEVAKLTYPKLIAYMKKGGKYIAPNLGFSAVQGGSSPAEPEKEHSVEDAMQFVSLFSGIE